MAAQISIYDTTSLKEKKSSDYIISSFTNSAWQLKKELGEESDETKRKEEVECLDFPFGNLTYPEIKSIALIGSKTGLSLQDKSLEREESYDSLASAVPYSKEEVSDHLKCISDLLTEVKKEFNDKENRQIFFFEVKEHLGNIWEIEFLGNEYFLQAVSLIEDSLFYIRSEDLSMEQVDGLMDVIEICKKIDMSIDDVRICGRILRSKKIATLPTLR